MINLNPVNSSNIQIPQNMTVAQQSFPQNISYQQPTYGVAGHPCNNSFVDNLLTGLTNIILQSFANVLERIGLGNIQAPTTNANITTTNPLQPNIQNIANREQTPSWLERGVDLVSGLFGGKLDSIFSIFKGGAGTIFNKASEVLGKIF